MELKPVTISFKNTPEEQAIYQIINSHSSKSAFIKDTLIDALIKKQPIRTEKIENCKNEINEIFDM